MPQLDTTYLISQIFWLTVCFGVFYLCIKFLVAPRLQSIIDTRDHTKNNNITKSHMLELEMKEMEAADHLKQQEVSLLIENLKKESDEKFKAYSKEHLEILRNFIASETNKAEKEIEDLKKHALQTPDVERHITESAKDIIFKLTGNGA